MKHRIAGYKLKRTANERQQLFRQLIAALITHDRLKTTKAKASAIQNIVEELVTRAKAKTPQGLAGMNRYITNPVLRKRFENEVVPRLGDRTSGYTQLVNMGVRFSDHAHLALLQFTYGQTGLSEKDSQGKTADQREKRSAPKEGKKHIAKPRSKTAQTKKGEQ